MLGEGQEPQSTLALEVTHLAESLLIGKVLRHDGVLLRL